MSGLRSVSIELDEVDFKLLLRTIDYSITLHHDLARRAESETTRFDAGQEKARLKTLRDHITSHGGAFR